MNLNTLKKIHFIGIGGISMSALALIMRDKNCIISGSDRSHSETTDWLESKGIEIYYGHDDSNIDEPDLVVYTSAIGDDNPEFVAAKRDNLPLMSRSEFLGLLMKSYDKSLTVAGTHGKTTTTGMVATILEHLNTDSTILIGGFLKNINGNLKIGSGNWILTEACEYKENFLDFSPTHSIILNVDEDHLDYFSGIDHIKSTFKNYAALHPKEGALILNSDDVNSAELISNNPNCITFGINSNADFQAFDINHNDFGYPNFKFSYNNKVYNVQLKVFGTHNILNALAAIALCYSLELPINKIVEGIEHFTGTHRRFEQLGLCNGALIIDDYAHHPTELKSTLDSLASFKHQNILAVFQPHTYTRTLSLIDDFANILAKFNNLIITDIYAAREVNDGRVSSKDLVDKIKALSPDSKIMQMSSFDEISSYAKSYLKPNDVFITIGAGDVNKIANNLVKQ